MNDIMQLYILFILISFSGCSFFIGLPESSWTTSSQVCSLPGIEMINTDDVFNKSSDYMVYKGVEKSWTGTVVKHTRWAAFIGCGRSLSHMDFGISVKTAEDCLRLCSDYITATHFIIKDTTCYCLTYKPEINGDINDCRRPCTNASHTPCSSGRSALVFTFVEDLNTNPTQKYIENECLTTTQDKSKYVVSDCNENYLYGCSNNTFVIIKLSWYAYQEKCLEENSFILYRKDTLPKKATAETYYWTPIFRTHTVVTGKLTKEDRESCLAVSTVETNNYLTVENCTSRFPFLCSGNQKRNAIENSTFNKSPRFITLPIADVSGRIELTTI
ncbi:uncharacterized protein [Mytilus edulis]|uniref:uncharacterized protein n=1 Tax=Mytilus edulis TaxID=6550 RepID=UPI0039EE377C